MACSPPLHHCLPSLSQPHPSPTPYPRPLPPPPLPPQRTTHPTACQWLSSSLPSSCRCPHPPSCSRARLRLRRVTLIFRRQRHPCTPKCGPWRSLIVALQRIPTPRSSTLVSSRASVALSLGPRSRSERSSDKRGGMVYLGGARERRGRRAATHGIGRTWRRKGAIDTPSGLY